MPPIRFQEPVKQHKPKVYHEAISQNSPQFGVHKGKDTNRKIRKTEFIYIFGCKNGSSSSAVNTGEV